MTQGVMYLNEVSWIGGAERSLMVLLSCLDRSNYDPLAVCPEEGVFPEALRQAGIDTRVVPFYGLRARNPLRYFETLGRLSLLTREKPVRLVHVNHHYFSNYGVILGRVCRLPVLVHLRGVETDLFFDRFARWLVLADSVVCVSEAVRSRFLEYVTAHMSSPVADRTASRTTVVYNGVDLRGHCTDHRSLCAQFDIDPSCKVVGIVGQVIPEKGLREFVDAARIVCSTDDHVHFLVVGADEEPGRDYVAEMASYAKSIGIARHFSFTGFRPDATTLLGGLDVSVLASWQEALGRVVLESMVAGVPVVATEVGGVPEIVDHGVSGFLVPPRNAVALAEAIVGALRMDVGERKRMIANGRQTAGRFSVDGHAANIERLYSELLHKARGRAIYPSDLLAARNLDRKE